MSFWLWAWLVVAIVAGIGELLTTALFFAIVAAAAVLTALIALVLPVAVLQVALFAGMSLAGIAFLRPALLGMMGIQALVHGPGEAVQTRIAGRRATVTRTVDSAGGQIRIGDGEFWSARAYDPDDLIPVGASADVVVVDGLTALVTPVVPLRLEDDTQVSSEKGA
jgi:membrane protein implicated in regulation of membrane protease activity